MGLCRSVGWVPGLQLDLGSGEGSSFSFFCCSKTRSALTRLVARHPEDSHPQTPRLSSGLWAELPPPVQGDLGTLHPCPGQGVDSLTCLLLATPAPGLPLS